MRVKRTTVILAVAATAGVVVGGGYAVATALDSRTKQVHGFCSEMADAVGLYAGNPVTQMGYPVGRIDAIASKGDHVEVTFSLDGSRKFPADVAVVTRSKSLLADRSLELVGNYVSGPQLTPGTCTPPERSYTPKSISQIAGSASDFINAIAPSNGKDSIQNALAGLDTALQGNGHDAAELMQHAAAAMSNPDRMMSDLGSSIMNMAPMTEEALRQWSTIRSLLDQMPPVLQAAGSDLLPGAEKLTVGTGYLLKVLLDIQRNYGDLIWPGFHAGLSTIIHLAATRSKDIAGLLDTLPPIAAFLRQQGDSDPQGLTVSLARPATDAAPDTPPATSSLLDLVLAKKGAR